MTSRCQISGARRQAQAAPQVSGLGDRQVTSLTGLPRGQPVMQTTLTGKAQRLASALACLLRVQQTVMNQLQHRHILHARLQEERPVAAWRTKHLPPSRSVNQKCSRQRTTLHGGERSACGRASTDPGWVASLLRVKQSALPSPLAPARQVPVSPTRLQTRVVTHWSAPALVARLCICTDLHAPQHLHFLDGGHVQLFEKGAQHVAEVQEADYLLEGPICFKRAGASTAAR